MSEWESDADFYRNLLEMRSQALSRVVHRAEDAEATVRVLRGAVKALLAKDDPSAQEMAQKRLEEAYQHAKQEDMRLMIERDDWKAASMTNQRRIEAGLALIREMEANKDISSDTADMLKAELTKGA